MGTASLAPALVWSSHWTNINTHTYMHIHKRPRRLPKPEVNADRERGTTCIARLWVIHKPSSLPCIRGWYTHTPQRSFYSHKVYILSLFMKLNNAATVTRNKSQQKGTSVCVFVHSSCQRGYLMSFKRLQLIPNKRKAGGQSEVGSGNVSSNTVSKDEDRSLD